MQRGADIPVDADRPRLNFLGAAGFRQIDADIECFGVLSGHLPERVLDDDRRVAAHTQFQVDHLCVSVPPKEILVSAGGFTMPPRTMKSGPMMKKLSGA